MSLVGIYDTDNVFAKILRGELPSVKVFEDEATLAFMDVFPVSEGHTLIIPKNVNARNFLELPAECVGAYMQSVQRIAKAVNKALSPDGIRIIQFNGAPAGQTVFHLHFHVIPIYDGEPIKPHASGDMSGADALQPIADRIANALKDVPA